VTVREPLYTEQDRAELLALALYREGLCPLCGRPLEVCTADEADPKTAAFDVVWRVCNATRRLAEFKRATYSDDTKHPNREAHLLGTTIRKR
jgi:hypothetical protein